MSDHGSDALTATDHLYIGGEWVRSQGSDLIQVVDCTTEEALTAVPSGVHEDVDAAVHAAREAWNGWAALDVRQRCALTTRVAELLAARTDELASTITREVGMVYKLSRAIQVGLPIATFRSMADLAPALFEPSEVGNSTVYREPVGVVGAITPWNYPLHQVAAKVAPALAAGCTVVLKPSEVAPTSAFVLAEVMHEAEVPPGVFNLVTGTGVVVGERLAGHADIDMVSFTGSGRAGRRVASLAADNVTRVALELGGKGANVILDDADLQRAVTDAVGKAFLNSGQTCSALTRMIVPTSRLDAVEAIAADVAESFTVGDPFDPTTKLGPLASKAQQDRVREHIRGGIDEGARLLIGGPDRPSMLNRGFFVEPTIFSGVTGDMAIAREEIFGPVLVIMGVADEREAIDLANGTDYGLSAGVWSSDLRRAERVARSLRVGQVEINGGAYNPLAPFGGFRGSGYGREYGVEGIHEYLATRSVQY